MHALLYQLSNPASGGYFCSYHGSHYTSRTDSEVQCFIILIFIIVIYQQNGNYHFAIEGTWFAPSAELPLQMCYGDS